MIDGAAGARIGRTDLSVPRIGLGTAVLGNFQQAISDEDAVAVIDRALAKGVRYVDTAPLYGHGLAERRGGPAPPKGPRGEAILSAKGGRPLREGAPPRHSQEHDRPPFDN